MPVVRKMGSIEDVMPSLEELLSIQRIRAIMLELGGSPIRDIVDRYKVLSTARDTLKAEWRKVGYYKQSKTISKILRPAAEWISSPRNLDSDLTIYRGAIFRVWGNQFDSPEQLFAAICQTIELSEDEPVKLPIPLTDHGDWVFKRIHYSTEGSYSDDEFKLLILEEFDKERRHFERLKQKFDSSGITDTSRSRPRIPESVRIEVWRRDGGKCAKCGSREKLEYDHIVPLSRGGSNTARNIELLCEACNRRKSNNIE